ncbi:MAG: DUF1801 domain-containing protein, partial [Alphaproteobacteria bacterium]|nr:DUF1801 domain-containing protein [Alphaproteobacteria bacterium]
MRRLHQEVRQAIRGAEAPARHGRQGPELLRQLPSGEGCLTSRTPIATYIAALPGIRRERGAALDSLVRRLFPEAECGLGYRMPTYRLDGQFLAWAGQKKYLSVYTCSAFRIAAFRAKHPEVAGGVGCLNFRDTDSFPLRDLAQVVRNALRPSAALARQESGGNDRRSSKGKGDRRERP